MTGLGFGHLTIDDLLGFGVSILMLLMMLGIVVWFVSYIVEIVAKTGRRIRPNHDSALLRENERLRASLMDAQEENDYLRKIYRSGLPTDAEDGGRNAA